MSAILLSPAGLGASLDDAGGGGFLLVQHLLFLAVVESGVSVVSVVSVALVEVSLATGGRVTRRRRDGGCWG